MKPVLFRTGEDTRLPLRQYTLPALGTPDAPV
jgi:hypothetical protein